MNLLKRVPWKKLAHWAARKALEEAVKRDAAPHPAARFVMTPAEVQHPGCDVATAPEPVEGKPGRYACVACGTEFVFPVEAGSGYPMDAMGRPHLTLGSATPPRESAKTKEPHD